MADNLIQVLSGLDHCGCEARETYGVGSLAEEVSTNGFPQGFLAPRAPATATGASALAQYGLGASDDGPSRATWFLFGAGVVLAWPVFASLIGFGERRIKKLNGLGDASSKMLELQRKLENALARSAPMKEIRSLQRKMTEQEREDRRVARRRATHGR